MVSPRTSSTVIFFLALLSAQAHAVGRLADVTVIDRTSGATLPVYVDRGDYWVAGSPGARYAVAVRNRSSGRVLAVTSIDGVNVISGQTAAWDQTGYVFFPRQSYRVTGWRKSDQEVAAFEFSDARDSYASRTGRPADVGVIGVALFRERLPELAAVAPPDDSELSSKTRRADASRADAMAEPAMPPSPAPSPVPSAAGAAAPLERSSRASPESKSSVSKLGTAHGARETSVVSSTEFERLQSRPDEIIRIRYDSHENLVAAGIIRPPLAGRNPREPDAFPKSPVPFYAADPPAVLFPRR